MSNKGIGQKDAICTQCKIGFKFKPLNSVGKFCSKKCYVLFRKRPGFRILNSEKKPEGFVVWNKGKKGTLPPSWNKGLPKEKQPHFNKLHSIETKEKISKTALLRKGGVYSKNRLDRIHFKRTMQKLIFERDNYTCQMCGNRGELQIDHIQPWAQYVEMRFSIENCRTLCVDCHYFVTYGKKKPNHIKTWGRNLKQLEGRVA